MGRLVHTHSTYIDGLILVLKELAKNIKVKTITPGVIARSKGNSEKLKIKITRGIKGGYKLNARKGRSVQEIYITTSLGKGELEDMISLYL